MSTKYRAKEPNATYLATLTITDRIDVFTRVTQKNLLINSLQYCQREKGLKIYAYCIMTNHLHLICRAEEGFALADIIQNNPESRREWMLNAFKQACISLKRNQVFKVWQDGYHEEIAYSNSFIKQKMNYIHNNPVVARIVEFPEDYLFS